MESVVKNILKRRAKSFSQSAEFQQYLKALFDEACEDRAGITNSEVYTLVLQLYIYIAQQTNVIASVPPSKDIVRDFIRVADKNSDGIISFDECEVVALLLCEYCAYQVSSYWLVTYLLSPLLTLIMFYGLHLCTTESTVNFDSFQYLMEMKEMIPLEWQFLVDRPVLFLCLFLLVNRVIIPGLVSSWTSDVNSRRRKAHCESISSRSGSLAALSLDTSESSGVSAAVYSPGKKTTSIYDIYDDAPKSRLPTGSPAAPTAFSSPAGQTTPSSPEAPETTTSPSYPISYAQFQFVTSKDDAPKSSTSSPTSASTSSKARQKQKRRASAPPTELSRSLPDSPFGSDSEHAGRHSPGGKSKTPTVFKKLRNSFARSKKEEGGKHKEA
mmetsp:Transcript_3995/g.6783  ORF Transcript_3995/g.6783 Transcript_3995/m.6783 type:complete len:384 (+) Transcript_3995:139-1290(+)